MSSKNVPLIVYVDLDVSSALAKRAEVEKCDKATLVRQAIDKLLTQPATAFSGYANQDLDSRSTAWIVERGSTPNSYFAGVGCWSSDIDCAIRFARKIDAEIISEDGGFAREHVWIEPKAHPDKMGEFLRQYGEYLDGSRDYKDIPNLKFLEKTPENRFKHLVDHGLVDVSGNLTTKCGGDAESTPKKSFIEKVGKEKFQKFLKQVDDYYDNHAISFSKTPNPASDNPPSLQSTEQSNKQPTENISFTEEKLKEDRWEAWLARLTINQLSPVYKECVQQVRNQFDVWHKRKHGY